MGCSESKGTETNSQNKPEDKPAEEGQNGEQAAAGKIIRKLSNVIQYKNARSYYLSIDTNVLLK